MNGEWMLANVVQLFINVEEGMTCEADVDRLRWLLERLEIAEEVQARVDKYNHEEQYAE